MTPRQYETAFWALIASQEIAWVERCQHLSDYAEVAPRAVDWTNKDGYEVDF